MLDVTSEIQAVRERVESLLDNLKPGDNPEIRRQLHDVQRFMAAAQGGVDRDQRSLAERQLQLGKELFGIHPLKLHVSDIPTYS